MRIRTLLGEPMLHFLLIGIALFAAYRMDGPGDSGGRRIVITQGVVDDLSTQHGERARTLVHRAEPLDRVARARRDPVSGRVRLGLDRDDIVVKRRVRQKIEMIAEEDARHGRRPTRICPRTWRRTRRASFSRPSSPSSRCFSDHPPPAREWCAVAVGEALRNGATLSDSASRRCCRFG